eukprot:m.234010 g.234010  ORF g.234010 m.234010 type:complete len:1105 (+) comp17387_c0_seq14:1971-5285(+)
MLLSQHTARPSGCGSQSHDSLLQSCFEQFKAMRDQGHLTDAAIVAGDGSCFPIHRAILAAWTAKPAMTFSESPSLLTNDELQLAAPSDVCRLFIDLLYGAPVLPSLSLPTILALLRCSLSIDSQPLVQRMLDVVSQVATMEHVRLLWVTAESLTQPRLRDIAVQLWHTRLRHCGNVVTTQNDFAKEVMALPLSFVNALIASSDLPLVHEDVLAAWLQFALDQEVLDNDSITADMLQHVRAPLLSEDVYRELEAAIVTKLGSDSHSHACLKQLRCQPAIPRSVALRLLASQPLPRPISPVSPSLVDGSHFTSGFSDNDQSDVSSAAPRRVRRRSSSRRRLPLAPGSGSPRTRKKLPQPRATCSVRCGPDVACRTVDAGVQTDNDGMLSPQHLLSGSAPGLLPKHSSNCGTPEPPLESWADLSGLNSSGHDSSVTVLSRPGTASPFDQSLSSMSPPNPSNSPLSPRVMMDSVVPRLSLDTRTSSRMSDDVTAVELARVPRPQASLRGDALLHDPLNERNEGPATDSEAEVFIPPPDYDLRSGLGAAPGLGLGTLARHPSDSALSAVSAMSAVSRNSSVSNVSANRLSVTMADDKENRSVVSATSEVGTDLTDDDSTISIGESDRPITSLVVMGGAGMQGLATSVQHFDVRSQAWVHLPETVLPRQRAACAVLNNVMYVFGGDNAHGSAEKFDVATDANWFTLKPSSACLSGSCASAGKDVVYLSGGSSPNNIVHARLSVYNPAINDWIPKTAMPSARFMHAQVLVLSRYLVVIGGLDANGQASDRVFIYDTQQDVWHPGPSLAIARSRCEAVTLAGRLYVMGGLSSANAALNSVEVIDVADLKQHVEGSSTAAWTPGNPMLQPRYNFAAVTVFKRIAVMGGSCPMIDLHDADAVLQYDPKLDMWGYQSLSVVKAAITGSKTPIRRASKMRRRASLGRSLMSTLGVRSKLCAAVIKIPSNVSRILSVLCFLSLNSWYLARPRRGVCFKRLMTLKESLAPSTCHQVCCFPCHRLSYALRQLLISLYQPLSSHLSHPLPPPVIGASTVYGIVCNATSYEGVSLKALEEDKASPSLRRIQLVLDWLVQQGFIYQSNKDHYLPTLDLVAAP